MRWTNHWLPPLSLLVAITLADSTLRTTQVGLAQYIFLFDYTVYLLTVVFPSHSCPIPQKPSTRPSDHAGLFETTRRVRCGQNRVQLPIPTHGDRRVGRRCSKCCSPVFLVLPLIFILIPYSLFLIPFILYSFVLVFLVSLLSSETDSSILLT